MKYYPTKTLTELMDLIESRQDPRGLEITFNSLGEIYNIYQNLESNYMVFRYKEYHIPISPTSFIGKNSWGILGILEYHKDRLLSESA